MTPQAALAAALRKAEVVIGWATAPATDDVWTAAILAALPPGWRLTAEPPLAKLRAEHEPVIDYGYEFTCKCGWDSEDRPGTESYFDHLIDAKLEETP